MRNSIYAKLAVTNLKNNSKTYVPYIITATLTVMMYFIIQTLAKGGIDSVTLTQLMGFGGGVVVIFAVIFLFYTNSFLIKRRKKEIGVYNILGMEKRHIARMMMIETGIIAVISIGTGIIFGLLFSRLMFMVLRKMMNFDIGMSFTFSAKALVMTVVLFLAIFAVTLIYNLLQIQLSNPIELLNGGSQGEREPKTKWVLTILGLILLGIGYFIALTTKDPIEAMLMFFVAVICVIIGTYLLFTSGSITLLKMLKKNKNFYYKTNHFTAVSGMLYRMKQNAVGLANICILSTIVLVIVSTTVSLYAGTEDLLDARFHHSFKYAVDSTDTQRIDGVAADVEAALTDAGLKKSDAIEYTKVDYAAKVDGDSFKTTNENPFLSKNTAEVILMTVADYNRLEGKNTALTSDEVLVYSPSGTYGKDTVSLQGKEFKVKQELKDFTLEEKQDNRQIDGYYFFFADDSVMQSVMAKDLTKTYISEFNITGADKDTVAEFESKLASQLYDKYKGIEVDSRGRSEQSAYEMYGGLFFIGAYLGVMFLMATILIIYYKQISEGYDDKDRFSIMQKVGMSKREVKASIRSQVLQVFFLPLIVAVIHVAVAFPVITRILSVFNLTHTAVFLAATIISVVIFAIFYVIVYMITAREYYKIVN